MTARPDAPSASSGAEAIYDLAVIGGGVNGCGIARDAAGRGLKVHLAEAKDLAQATSSASTKLFHGGLRYLEFYEFRLVREALIERETLLRAMPHISWPLRFVLPHSPGLRPAWLLRLGLFIYDHLGGRKILPPTRTLDLREAAVGQPLKPELTRGFEYSDCWVQDSRLVTLNARDAAARGATIRTRTRLVDASREDGVWTLTHRDETTGETSSIRARALVNAAGPWVDEVLRTLLGLNAPAHIRLVRGSHIVTRKLFDHDRAYIFQNADGRIVFAIPYEGDYTLIGTTDRDHREDPSEARCTPEEADYLRRVASEYFATPIEAEDIVWTYSGVRPLYDDGAKSATQATRDYVLQVEAEGGAALLNVFGGKITTYRRLAESALEKLAPHLPGMSAPWTAGVPLPGGDFPVDGVAALTERVAAAHPFLAPGQAARLVRTYGTEALDLLSGATEPGDLGRAFGAGLTEREVRWLMTHEWARSAEDVVWRRTRLGLKMTADEIAALDAWMAEA
ncbi:MAG: glycerol-3-phosphate dehydrogenase [Pseudomonadota bacterium]|nr:glycerol-3-phosphate dehydrogenase [Pseudomonadota bacterium]MEE3101796.1 glycerol-3-phosphate dehydrogenase [Pseudomonadota bacterium]